MNGRLFAAALGVLCLTSLARADEPAIRSENNIVYRKVGERELKLDLVVPADGEKKPDSGASESRIRPAVLVIHGGAWRGGNKADVHPVLEMLARHGYVAVSPQYRFCPQDPYPAQIHDVKAAVRWMRANSGKYRLSRDSIGAMGFSAGGHLALMLGVTGPADGLEGENAHDSSSRVQAVVNYFGPTDLKATDIPDVCKPWVRDFLGAEPSEKPDAAAKASPMTFLSKDDAPILTFQGTRDPLVPFNQAIKLAEGMTTAGIGGRVELMAGAGHGWGGKEFERTMAETLAFLDHYLHGTREPIK